MMQKWKVAVGLGDPFGSLLYAQGHEFFNWLLGSAQFFEGRSPRGIMNNRNPKYYDAKVEGCCRAWGVLLGAISMYKGWSFSTKKKEMMQGGRKVEGCCRVWGVLLGAISMYKGWSFSTKKKAGRQKVGKV